MLRLVVSLTAPHAFRTVLDALRAPVPPYSFGGRHILIEPGHYPGTSFQSAGDFILTAVGGPGTVTLDGATSTTLRLEGHVTLQGLTIRNWHDEGSALRVPGGNVFAEKCEFVSRPGTFAVSAWDGASVALRDCKVSDGAIAYSSSTGVLEGTTVQGASGNAVALRTGSAVTLRACRILDAGRSGIWATEGSRPVVERTTVSRTGRASILVNDRADAIVRNASLEQAGECALVVRDNATALIEDVRIVESGQESVWATTGARITARRVLSEDGRRGGLWVSGGATAVFEECEIHRTAAHGMIVGDATCSVTGGAINASGEMGLRALSGSRVTANFTTFTASGVYGVSVAGGAEVTLVDCGVSGSTDRGIVVEPDGVLYRRGGRSEGNGGPDLLDGTRRQLRVAPGGSSETTAPDTPGGDSEPTRVWLAELDSMIGLGTVKQEIKKSVNLQKVAERRRRAGLPPGPSISRHVVFAGETGTGKSTVARLYGGLLASLGVVDNGRVVEVGRADLVPGADSASDIGQRAADVFERARGGVLFLDDAHRLAGTDAVEALVKLIEEHRDDVIVIVAGPDEPLREFLGGHPGLRTRFSRTIDFGPYTPEELAGIVETHAIRDGFRLAPRTRQAIVAHFSGLLRDETAAAGGHEARQVFEAAVERQAQRLADGEPTVEELTLLLPEDLDVAAGLVARFGVARDPERLAAVLDRVTSLVGLDGVKRDVRALLDSGTVPGNLVFAGPSGTGKTTVARLYAELLAALGVLPDGRLVKVAPGELTAVDDGVLYIDDAHLIGDDVGPLLKLVDDPRHERAVIVAGPSGDVDAFLASHPALASRFARTLNFAPYDVDDLVRMLAGGAGGHLVPPDAEAAVRAYVEANRDRFLIRNGHEVADLLAAMEAARLDRTGGGPSPFTPDDVPSD